MLITFEWHVIVISARVVAAAFIVFGISAFGSALITVPVLSHFYPLDFVLPVCVLLDVSAAIAMGSRFSRNADRSELKRMAPLCLIGAVLGTVISISSINIATTPSE